MMQNPRISQYWRSVGETDNLAELSKLDENIILDELKARYIKDVIYTYVGDILIAVNPLKDLPVLYEKKVAVAYRNAHLAKQAPHIYAIASHVYKCMLGFEYDTGPQDQCIVISGESGAGKTESTKLVVKQIIELCNGNTQLEQQILQVNPLLEAFGNAKTVANDNSSRFGKYIQLLFTSGKVVGAKINEYLLEKSRVVQQNSGDANFHIFSYMFTGCSEEQRSSFKLSNPNNYRYTRSSEKVNSNVSHQEKFEQLQNAMDLVGFSEQEQNDMLAILSGVLSIGNVNFADKVSNERVAITYPEDLQTAAELFGVHSTNLVECLTCLCNQTRGEQILINYSKQQAEDARDAAAKMIYGRLFSWIVNKINQRLAPDHRSSDQQEIGILDIFGFENFESNSFEQACINLANEHLQFFFNEHIFSLEQEEYKSEGIKWAHISYCDNQPLLDLYLKRMGILSLLDEESHFPQGTDASFVSKLNKNLNSYACYKSHKSVSKPCFTIKHYAGEVTYDVQNWLEKNRDTIPPSLMNILKLSNNMLLRTIFKGTITRTGTLALQNRTRKSVISKKAPRPSTTAPSNTRKLTVGTQFKNSLQELIKQMSQAEPHFIRCLKPNSSQQPGRFDDKYVLSQLSYTGMLQTVQIRRDGYAFRPLIADFISTYKPLLLHRDVPVDSGTCKQILRRSDISDWHVGKTKVFLKHSHAEVLAHQLSDLIKATIRLQTVARGFLARKYILKLRKVSQQHMVYVESFLQSICSNGSAVLEGQQELLKHEQKEQEEKEREEKEQEKKEQEEKEQEEKEQEEKEREERERKQKEREEKEREQKERQTQAKIAAEAEKRESSKLLVSTDDKVSHHYYTKADISRPHSNIPQSNIRKADEKPARPAKPQRLSASAVESNTPIPMQRGRRPSRSQLDPLPLLPSLPSPPVQSQPQPSPRPLTVLSPTSASPQRRISQKTLLKKLNHQNRSKSFVDRFTNLGYGGADEDDEVIEDDFSMAHKAEVDANPYGPIGAKQTTIEWFKNSQMEKLARPFSDKPHEWFHGIIPRKKAEKMLMLKSIGAYMIRLSEKRLGYVLTFRAETRCRHYMVDPTPSNKYVVVGEPKVHKTLQELVDYHRKHSLSNWHGVLTEPCGQFNPDSPDYRELWSLDHPDSQHGAASNVSSHKYLDMAVGQESHPSPTGPASDVSSDKYLDMVPGQQSRPPPTDTYVEQGQSNGVRRTSSSSSSSQRSAPPLPPKLHTKSKTTPNYISYK